MDNPLFNSLMQFVAHAKRTKEQKAKATRGLGRGTSDQAVHQGWEKVMEEALRLLGSTFLEYMNWYLLEQKAKKKKNSKTGKHPRKKRAHGKSPKRS